jgi:hypothetical protein
MTHHLHTGRRFAFLAIATMALLLPGLATLAQDPLDTDDSSPATRHAQVIAQGVAPLPADEITWELTVDRALSPTRADPEGRPAGFILADKGVVALVDQRGTRLARIAPGEAVWIEPGVPRAVIGLDRKAPTYYDIALVPATELAAGDPAVIGGAPFVAPAGDTFDVDLIRDVLNRTEESAVSIGPSPALLLVTSGTALVESSSGLVEMTTGDAAQVAGDVVITGAGRAPAAFVVARIGSEVPAPAAAEASPSIATSAPVATPVSPEQSASVTISASLCPIGDAERNDTVDCAAPATDVGFNLMSDVVSGATSQTSEDGHISFTGIEPGHYILSAEQPADFASSRVRCRNASGDTLAARTATNQIATLLAAGDQVACTWYLVPTETQGELPADPTAPPTATTTSDEIDSDADGLTDEQETTVGTDPSLPDSDADGVSDSDEIDFYGTDALDPDTDADGLADTEELLTHGTNPLLDDTDGDGVSDGEEVAAGSDPLDAASVPATLTPVPTSTPEPTSEPTSEPALQATPALSATPLSTPDAAEASPPGQELGTGTESVLRSRPMDDLDDDGLSTADEVAIYGTNVAVADSDGDDVSDGDEVAAGSDPLDASDN